MNKTLLSVITLLVIPHSVFAISLAEKYKSGAEWTLVKLQEVGIEKFGAGENETPVQEISKALQNGEIKFIEVSDFNSPAKENRKSAFYSPQEKTVYINKNMIPSSDILPYLALHETLGAYGLEDPDYQLSIGTYFYLRERYKNEIDLDSIWRRHHLKELLQSHATKLMKILKRHRLYTGGGGTVVGGGGDSDAMIFKIRMIESVFLYSTIRPSVFIFSAGPWIQVELADDQVLNKITYQKTISPISLLPGFIERLSPYVFRPRILVPRNLALRVNESLTPQNDPTMQDVLFFLESFFWAQTKRAANRTYFCDGEKRFLRNPHLIHPDGFRLFEEATWKIELRLYNNCRKKSLLTQDSN